MEKEIKQFFNSCNEYDFIILDDESVDMNTCELKVMKGDIIDLHTKIFQKREYRIFGFSISTNFLYFIINKPLISKGLFFI